MTLVIGNAFNALATFPAIVSPTEHDKHKLVHDVGIVALELIALAAGSLALSSIMSSLWLWAGERIVMRIRSRVFAAVTSRDMEWFDLLGGGNEAKSTDDQVSENVGAGGLMAKFTRCVAFPLIVLRRISHLFLTETRMMFGQQSLSTLG